MTPRRKQYRHSIDSAHGKGLSRLKSRGHKHLSEAGVMQVCCKRCHQTFYTYDTENIPQCIKPKSE